MVSSTATSASRLQRLMFSCDATGPISQSNQRTATSSSLAQWSGTNFALLKSSTGFAATSGRWFSWCFLPAPEVEGRDYLDGPMKKRGAAGDADREQRGG